MRELVGDEAERLEAAIRDDYVPFFALPGRPGYGCAECLLKWTEVDWDAQQIRKLGKGGKTGDGADHLDVREILWPLHGHHPEMRVHLRRRPQP